MTLVPVDYTDRLEIASAVETDLGEGPVWDASNNRLIFVDSNRGHIYRLNPGLDELCVIDVGHTIGVAIPRAGGGLVASSADGLLSIRETPLQVSLLVPIERNLPNNRMNDGKCDSRGRLWSGTFSTLFERGAGSLYRIDPDLSCRRIVENVRISNGIGWSPDERLLYFNDTLSQGIDVFDYDVEEGMVSNRRRLVEIKRDSGLPDGMTVDAEGCIWVSLFYGGQVRRYSPAGQLIGKISLPVSRVTSCNFGGPGLEDLYITTANLKIHDDGRPHEPAAGFLFRCRPGVKGLPSHAFAG